MSYKLTNIPDNSKALVRHFLLKYQDDLCRALEQLDGGAAFVEDKWQKSNLGSGRTRVIVDGNYFEQGGVNFSEIQGAKIPQSLLGLKPDLAGVPFWGAGVSMVLHPENPFCPTVHLNYRYFEAGSVWWFGGGADLTPYYPFIEDCVLWHEVHKNILDQHDPNYYPAFKYWCDEYFYLHHRSETRGIGGVFYDYQDGAEGLIIKPDYARMSDRSVDHILNLKQGRKSWEQMFAMQQAVACGFLDAYLPIAQRRRSQTWSKSERDFQLYRRGRYVEFNLLYDRGTKFGLQSKGRTESILMSLPPLVRWAYNYRADSGSRESELTDTFLHRGIDWLNK